MSAKGGTSEPALGWLTFVDVDHFEFRDGCNTTRARFTIEREKLAMGSGVSTATDDPHRALLRRAQVHRIHLPAWRGVAWDTGYQTRGFWRSALTGTSATTG